MEKRPAWNSRANVLTGARLLLAPVLAVCVLEEARLAAALSFWLAVATDFADGRVARRFGEVSAYGRFFDHATDAAFVSVGTAALAVKNAVPAVLPLLIALAFVQYAVGRREPGAQEPRKSRLGHWNGIAYYVIVAVPVTRDAMGIAWPPPAWVLFAGWLLVATTLVSIGSRLRFA